jgi:hypothetical protein
MNDLDFPAAGELGWLWAVSDDPSSGQPSSGQTPSLLRTSARRIARKTDIPAYKGRFIWGNYVPVTPISVSV